MAGSLPVDARSLPEPRRSGDLRDEQSLRAAYATHADELYRFALRELRGEGSAQDVSLRAWWAADSYDARLGGVRTWLFTVARNVPRSTRWPRSPRRCAP